MDECNYQSYPAKATKTELLGTCKPSLVLPNSKKGVARITPGRLGSRQKLDNLPCPEFATPPEGRATCLILLLLLSILIGLKVCSSTLHCKSDILHTVDSRYKAADAPKRKSNKPLLADILTDKTEGTT